MVVYMDPVGLKPYQGSYYNLRYMGSSQSQGAFLGPQHIVRYPYKEDPKRAPNVENYPYSRVKHFLSQKLQDPLNIP